MLLLGSHSTSRTEFHGFHSVTVSDTTTMVLGYFQPAPMLYTHICIYASTFYLKITIEINEININKLGF